METQVEKPRLLILSHILPFPGEAGQQRRVYYTLQTAREFFHVTFVTSVDARDIDEVQEKLSALCDKVAALPTKYSQR